PSPMGACTSIRTTACCTGSGLRSDLKLRISHAALLPAQKDSGDVVGSAGRASGVDEAPALGFERLLGPQNSFQLLASYYSMQAVAGEKRQGAGLPGDPISVDHQIRAGADSHGQHVAKRMGAQAGFVETERAAHFVDPALILSDRAKRVRIEHV